MPRCPFPAAAATLTLTAALCCLSEQAEVVDMSENHDQSTHLPVAIMGEEAAQAAKALSDLTNGQTVTKAPAPCIQDEAQPDDPLAGARSLEPCPKNICVIVPDARSLQRTRVWANGANGRVRTAHVVRVAHQFAPCLPSIRRCQPSCRRTAAVVPQVPGVAQAVGAVGAGGAGAPRAQADGCGRRHHRARVRERPRRRQARRRHLQCGEAPLHQAARGHRRGALRGGRPRQQVELHDRHAHHRRRALAKLVRAPALQYAAAALACLLLPPRVRAAP